MPDALDDDPREESRRRPTRRAPSVDIGFEEWGRGPLVLVGPPRRDPRALAHASPPPDATRETTAEDHPSLDAADGVAHARAVSPHASRLGVDEIEGVAIALETIALRVRVGEFRVRGLVPDMSDVAILATTLASILAPSR